MKITRKNYESYFLDYIEGNLSTELLHELEIFLSENPDLKAELNDFDNLSFNTGESNYTDKSSLKHDVNNISTISEDTYEEFCIAFAEGDLNELKQKELLDFKKGNAQKESIFNFYNKAKLTPDKEIIYTDKESLQKKQDQLEVNDSNYDELCIAYYEGNLSEIQRQNLLQYTKQHPEVKPGFEAYARLKLKPDVQINFPDKLSLKRSRRVKLISYGLLSSIAVAAALIIAFFVFYDNNEVNINSSSQIAEISKPVKPTENKLNKKPAEIKNNDVKKTEAKKATQKKQTQNKKVDSDQKAPVKTRTLQPLIINPGKNYQLSSTQIIPDIVNDKVTIAFLGFNFDVKPDLPDNASNDREYITLSAFVIDRFRKSVLGDKYAENKKVTYYDVAQAGINEINKIIPGKVDFEQETNTNGELKHLAVNTRYLGFSKNFRP